ncbi:DUF2188 domain-containing protein [Salipaludibacillus daqingensis]|uniref:DUF2188 domain-containing protein n=1 Tax=Salipaludibacillus daqingensis TaxID=3041001 RepID=UPI0024731D0B|nr:DUF2188 domain-containing protein [Salipaludibacillus daqingensis]
MPWDTNDYPESLKNLNTPIRKKAIEIANAMVDEGYKEGQAIPIATEQAKEWYENASKKEINRMTNKTNEKLTEHDGEKDESNSRPELLDKGEHVYPHDNGWAVQAEDAKQPSHVFDNKKDAISRAREIAKKKETHLVVHLGDGSVQQKQSYDEK